MDVYEPEEITETDNNTPDTTDNIDEETTTICCPLPQTTFHQSSRGCYMLTNGKHVYSDISITRRPDGSFFFLNISLVEKMYKAISRPNSTKGALVTPMPMTYGPMYSVMNNPESFKILVNYLLDLGDVIFTKTKFYPCVKEMFDFVVRRDLSNTIHFMRLVLFVNKPHEYYKAWKYAFVNLLQTFAETGYPLHIHNTRNTLGCTAADLEKKRGVVYVQCLVKLAESCPNLIAYKKDDKNFDFGQACIHVRKYIGRTKERPTHVCMLYSLDKTKIRAFNTLFGRQTKLHAICCCPDASLTKLWFREFRKMLGQYNKKY